MTERRQTDATDIRNFTDDVFKLKGLWEEARILLDTINVPRRERYKPKLQLYQEFIQACQFAANDARAGALSTFREIVLTSALDPSLSTVGKRREAFNAIQMITTNHRCQWTSKDSQPIGATLDQAVRNLEALKSGHDRINNAKRRVSILNKQHLDLQAQMSGGSKTRPDSEGKRLPRIIAILLRLLTPKSTHPPLARWLDGDGLSSSLEKRDRKIQANLMAANRTVDRLQVAQKMTAEELGTIERLLEMTKQLATEFKLVAPKLAQVCAITEDVNNVIRLWIAFLDLPETQSLPSLPACIAQLQATSNMYDPLAAALAELIARPI